DVEELPDARADQEAHGAAEEGAVGPYRLGQLGIGLQRELGGLPVGREVVLAAQPGVIDTRRVGPARIDPREGAVLGHQRLPETRAATATGAMPSNRTAALSAYRRIRQRPPQAPRLRPPLPGAGWLRQPARGTSRPGRPGFTGGRCRRSACGC